MVKGVKSENEKFAGGLFTTTIEGFIPTTGRGIQAATSHCLGQNFSKMFDIQVEDPNKSGEVLHVWQNSWGLSTRSIGVMVMTHGDDKGMVTPPRVAPLQVVVIPSGLTTKLSAEKRAEVFVTIEKVVKELQDKDVRVRSDIREGYTPGFKWSHWEMMVRRDASSFLPDSFPSLTFPPIPSPSFFLFLSSGCPPPSRDWPQGHREGRHAHRPTRQRRQGRPRTRLARHLHPRPPHPDPGRHVRQG